MPAFMTRRALREDMAATRAPLPEALALAHRLSRSGGGLRYSTASAVFERSGRRRPPPETVQEILSWAPYPLASAEVAELRGIDIDQARDELQRSGAQFDPAAGDGYWSTT